ncbi:hypothetical protein ACEUUP_07400 [Staphylococcus pseudintermedius]
MTISKHERNRISELEVDIESYKRIHKDYKKAWSDNPYYDRVQQRLNKIMEDE